MKLETAPETASRAGNRHQQESAQIPASPRSTQRQRKQIRPDRLTAWHWARAAFTTGLNRILLVAAVIALVSGVVSLAAIRGRDFA